MKKVFLGVLIIVTVAILVLWLKGQDADQASTSSGTQTGTSASSQSDVGSTSENTTGPSSQAKTGDNDSDGLIDQQARPATDIYQNAEEALKAVRDGAKNYDDLVLEQFTELGPHCSWCDSFYQSLRELTFGADTSTDERSFYSELLAVSGRVDNIEALLQAAEAAQGQDAGQVYAEALELTVGGDDVVNFLGSKITSSPPELKETLVAAISNQGSDLTVNTLYRATVEMGNPDGYYSQGTGLGELIPDEASYPSLKEFISKRDDYSHLAVKALFNSGTDGVKAAFEVLGTAADPEKDRKILKDAIDHLSFEEGLETFLKTNGLNHPNPALAELSKQALEAFEKQQEELASEEAVPSDVNLEELLNQSGENQ